MRRIADVGLVALLLGLAAAIVALDPAHGPVVLSLSATHGVDAWDLPAAPFAILGVAVARGRCFRKRSTASWRWAAPASTVTLGILLLLAGVLEREGGPLVPAGGGVFDRTVTQAVDRRPVPVDRWTYLALTYDGEQERLYVNGAAVSRHPAGGSLQTPDSPLWIGGNHPWGSHFNGLIDDVRVYGRALSATELRRDMARPAARHRASRRAMRSTTEPARRRATPQATTTRAASPVRRGLAAVTATPCASTAPTRKCESRRLPR